MRQNNARHIIEKLMEEHGLIKNGWTYEFKKDLQHIGPALGLCSFTSKKLSFDESYISKSGETRIHQLVLHEIAHAISPMGVGHSKVWVKKARSIGYHPRWVGYEPEIMKHRNSQLEKASAAIAIGVFLGGLRLLLKA